MKWNSPFKSKSQKDAEMRVAQRRVINNIDKALGLFQSYRSNYHEKALQHVLAGEESMAKVYLNMEAKTGRAVRALTMVKFKVEEVSVMSLMGASRTEFVALIEKIGNNMSSISMKDEAASFEWLDKITNEFEDTLVWAEGHQTQGDHIPREGEPSMAEQLKRLSEEAAARKRDEMSQADTESADISAKIAEGQARLKKLAEGLK